MFDPREGIGSGGEIRTGADRTRVADVYEPVLAAVCRGVLAADTSASTYLYGSVATGMAQVPHSDVDILTVGLSSCSATALQCELSERFARVCRGVEIAVATAPAFVGGSDQHYGNRVFLRHYCIHLMGPEVSQPLPVCEADARAARGLNGDIESALSTWRDVLHSNPMLDAHALGSLGRRVARKTLVAVAALVSVHDATWTTDRALAAARWGQVRPGQVEGLAQLLSWSRAQTTADREHLAAALSARGIVDLVVDDFHDTIGLWR